MAKYNDKQIAVLEQLTMAKATPVKAPAATLRALAANGYIIEGDTKGTYLITPRGQQELGWQKQLKADAIRAATPSTFVKWMVINVSHGVTSVRSQWDAWVPRFIDSSLGGNTYTEEAIVRGGQVYIAAAVVEAIAIGYWSRRPGNITFGVQPNGRVYTPVTEEVLGEMERRAYTNLNHGYKATSAKEAKRASEITSYVAAIRSLIGTLATAKGA